MFTHKPTWGTVFQVPATMTGDDLLHLPIDGGKNELYDGELVREEMTAPGQSDVCHRLGFELGLWARNAGYSKRVLQNALFDLTQPGATSRTILAPDLAIWPSSAPPPWNHIPQVIPLLAIEVVSDSQTLTELGIKAQVYRNAGVPEVWVIDHASRVVEFWTATGMTTFTASDDLTSVQLPGFRLAVATLLDG